MVAMLTAENRQRLGSLRWILGQMERVLVAFSGGVDSALVLHVAHDVLGDDAVALTALSETFPPEELEQARLFADGLGVTHHLVESHELESEGYAANNGDRCYFCKSELFELAADRARLFGIPWIADGTIVDDLGDHRPGLVAATENLVRHPLVEAGFDKSAVRSVAQHLGIEVWAKPSFACLGSRFAVGTRVTEDRVRKIQRVESYLRTIGLTQFRARYHLLEGREMVRIEVDPGDFATVTQFHESIQEVCVAEGFEWVTLDLIGYRMGGAQARAQEVKTSA